MATHTADPQVTPFPLGSLLSRWVPLLAQLENYSRETFLKDLVAGVVVAMMLIPQSIAYATLAGLPPQAGLTISLFPLVIYGMLGSSRTLAVGPAAMISILVASTLSKVADPYTTDYIAYAMLLALMVGLIQMLMGILRLGIIERLLKHEVLDGFINAAAILIALSQMKYVFGVTIPRHSNALYTLRDLFANLTNAHVAPFILTAMTLMILFYFRRRLPQKITALPKSLQTPLAKSGALLVVILGTIIASQASLGPDQGVKIVGEIPSALPQLGMPSIELAALPTLFPMALTISLIGFIESLSIAKVMAKTQGYKVNPNQELIALGTANCCAACTGGYPIAGGLSRSMVNFSSGAQSGFASIVTAFVVLLTIIFLTPLFYHLPYAVLAGIILMAVTRLFDFSTLRHHDRTSVLLFAATFAAVLLLGAEYGLFLGIALSLSLYLLNQAIFKPR